MALRDQPPLEIEAADLMALRAGSRDYMVLDVREAWELEICSLPEAVHLPLGALIGRESELPRDRPVVVICHSGHRSLLAARHLRQLGLTCATSLRGGLDDWACQADPDMARY